MKLKFCRLDKYAGVCCAEGCYEIARQFLSYKLVFSCFFTPIIRSNGALQISFLQIFLYLVSITQDTHKMGGGNSFTCKLDLFLDEPCLVLWRLYVLFCTDTQFAMAHYISIPVAYLVTIKDILWCYLYAQII